MAGFELNQQDAFNQRNDIDRMNQFGAELEKATASIGAAELAAERELAELKLKNLAIQQEARIKKLDQLIKREEDGIKKLAELRRELSEKQFEACEKAIKKELQLLGDTIDELRKAENERTKKSEPKATEDTDNVSNAKTAEDSASDKTTFSTLTSSVSSIDKTLSALHDTVVGYIQSNPKGHSTNTGDRSSIIEDLKSSGAGAQEGSNSTTNNGENEPTKDNKGEGAATPPKEEKQFTNDAQLLDPVDLGHYSFEAVFNAFESLKDSLPANSNARSTLHKVTDKGGKDVSQNNIDLAGDLLVSIKKAEAAEQKVRDIKVDENTGAAKADEIELNRKLLFEEELQKRREEYANKEYQLSIAQINAEADIAYNAEHNKELMAQALYEEQIGWAQKYADLQLQAGKYAVDQAKFEKDQARKANKAAKKDAVSGITDGLKKFGTGEFSMADVQDSYGKFMNKRTAQLEADGANKSIAKFAAGVELAAEAAGTLADALDAKVKEISAMQGIVDTRLQGSKVNERDFGNGSYWNQLLEEIKLIAGASPFVKQEKIVENVKALIDKGISFDVKQRAFLMTIQEKIANTFDVADGTLLRLIRIQQQDTTAGRLGMESALNSFLNSMYETSEYLSDVAASVRSSLFEMQSFETGEVAAELEFQVQKWMGSLYSVGMSQDAVHGIAQAFGQIASGDVSGLIGNSTGNLLIMAANEAGLSIADILQEGLDADETNKLMQAMVNYLAEIAETSSDSRVVQQQLASVYGVRASDLKAATNLSTSIKDVSKQDLTYSGMMGQLNNMMNTIRLRTSVGEGMTNMWDNMMYSMASTQASNPILYLLPKMADLLRDVTGGGGIALPGISVMGNMVDLHTSVADLMSVASMAGTALGSLGPVLLGLSDLVNPLAGSTMLIRAGINPIGKAPVLARGSATPFQNLRGLSISESGQIVGNSSGEDIKKQTLQGAEDDKKKQMVEAKDEESSDDIAIRAQQAVVDIYNLLEEVAHGSQSLRVRVINNSIGVSAGGGGAGGASNTIGNSANVGSTGAMSNGVNSGADNGNWVLSF